MVTFENEKVVILPQAKKFFSSIDKKDLNNLIVYLYYFYDKESIYKNVLPSERKEIIINSFCKGFNIDKYDSFIKNYEYVIMTPTQRLALSLIKRIEKIVNVLDESEINIEDLEQEGKNMKALSEMFKLDDVLKAKLAVEQSVNEGKGSKIISPYEDLTF